MSDPERKQQQVQHPLALTESLSPDDLEPITELASNVARIQPPLFLVALGGVVMGTTPSGGASPAAPLTPKDFPSVADRVKHKLQRARVQVKAMPDAARTISEQKEEIDELQKRVAKQLDVLRDMREAGLSFAREQQQKDKMEVEDH